MLIHDLAKKVGLHPNTIRRLEKTGVIHSNRDVNNWRRYDESAVDQLRKLYGAAVEEPGREGEG